MEYDLLEKSLLEIAKDVTECYSAPGLPVNYVTFITKNVQVIGGFNDNISVCNNTRQIEEAINTCLAPIVLMYGIDANGIRREGYTHNGHYSMPGEILENVDEDYEVESEVLNYVYSIIAAVNHLKDMDDNEVIMIMYCGEAGISSIEHFDNVEHAKKVIYEEYEVERRQNL